MTSLRTRSLQASKGSLSTTSYGVNTLPDKLSHRYGFGLRMEQEFNDPVIEAPGHWRGQITSKDVPGCCVPAKETNDFMTGGTNSASSSAVANVEGLDY